MTRAPLLSVVIPTRNRQRYAAAAVRQIIGATSPAVEVVVQDNSDDDSLGQLLGDLDQGRISYVWDGGTTSFAENFSGAASRARGVYVCFIGDDDGVLPQIEGLARWANERGVEAITTELPAVYYWPGSMKGSRADLDGSLVIGPLSVPRARTFSTRESVRTLMARGGVDYLSLPLVKVYHGLVKRTLLVAVSHRTGHYFGGLSPDIYASVALSIEAGEVLLINWPVTLPGICGGSGSADSASGRHTGALADAPHFRGHDNYPWPTEVPAVYCVETIWAEGAICAAREMGADFSFGSNCLSRVVWRRHPELRALVERPPRLSGATQSFRIAASRVVRGLSIRLRSRRQRPQLFPAPTGIEHAARLLADLVDRQLRGKDPLPLSSVRETGPRQQ